VLAAAAHAIATGVWIRDLPITPERILDAIQERQKEKATAWRNHTIRLGERSCAGPSRKHNTESTLNTCGQRP
jgi:hypothetical protein